MEQTKGRSGFFVFVGSRFRLFFLLFVSISAGVEQAKLDIEIY